MVKVFTKRLYEKRYTGISLRKMEGSQCRLMTDKDGTKRYLMNLRVNGDDFTVVVKANTCWLTYCGPLEPDRDKKGCEIGNCDRVRSFWTANP